MQLKYKTWLWWTRFAMVITVLQFIGATYLMFRVAKYVSRDGLPRNCVLGTLLRLNVHSCACLKSHTWPVIILICIFDGVEHGLSFYIDVIVSMHFFLLKNLFSNFLAQGYLQTLVGGSKRFRLPS